MLSLAHYSPPCVSLPPHDPSADAQWQLASRLCVQLHALGLLQGGWGGQQGPSLLDDAQGGYLAPAAYVLRDIKARLQRAGADALDPVVPLAACTASLGLHAAQVGDGRGCCIVGFLV